MLLTVLVLHNLRSRLVGINQILKIYTSGLTGEDNMLLL